MHEDRRLLEDVRRAARPLTGAASDYDSLLERVGEAQFVLLGEASHGTHDLYHERARVTQRLIEEKGFGAVVVEADWPDAYYRAMFGGRVSSWNLRDRHMVDTLEAVVEHQRRTGPSPKVVVWAHNSHLGDARFTEAAERGEINVGQLLRERHGSEVVNVGFTTHTGTVTAASDWDGPAERKRVLPSRPDSYEALFHDVGGPFLLLLGDSAPAGLREPRLERAIGVIYRPETERLSHYFHARLPQQFDVVLHFDETRAVEPLERVAPPTEPELAETYPSGV